ncbi:MAG: hypothetical protein ASARMPREDX12_008290 [Alectoria sarmentosa]|nr:MAG: hypothetical protein ASARMPREDX12_008290 [Alectoria sarmentosa]
MVDRHSTLELVEHDGRSTLELVRHDETARAPERDNDATAFELDAGCLAPEALPGTAPQLHYRNSLPEVNSSIEKSTEQPTGRDAPKSLIELFYVSQSHHLNSTYTDSNFINWQYDTNNGLTKYVTASNTRSLSVTSNPYGLNSNDTLPGNATSTTALLFYENSNANVSVLLRTAKQCVLGEGGNENITCIPKSDIANASIPITGFTENWTDNSSALRNSYTELGHYTNFNLGTPFVSVKGPLTQGGAVATFSVQTFFTESSMTPLLSDNLTFSETSIDEFMYTGESGFLINSKH